MRILLVDLEFDYGVKARGINTIGQLGFKKSLEKLGHSVINFYYDSYLNGRLADLQIDLINRANEENPDIIFFILFKDQFETDTLEKLRQKYITVNWFGDDSWRFEFFTRKYSKYFTYCVTTDKYSIPKYKQNGIKNIISAQWAAIDDDYRPDPLPFQYDVSFVGGKNPFREFFVNYLNRNGIQVHCFGNGWKNGPVTNEEMIKIFASSKINLNLSNSASFDLRYLISNPKNLLHSFHTKKTSSQIKARNFEINYFSGFQLTDYVPSLEDYYYIGKEVVCYSTPEDALTQIKYYLENETERKAIQEAGSKKARVEYTYTGQLRKVFNEITL